MAKQATYPADHKPGMRVTKPGSSCANCEYLRPGLHCANTYFQKWHGSNKIPTTDASSYCSDWWSPRERAKQTAGEMLRDQTEKK